MNEFQVVTLSASLAVFGINWLFFGFGDDDNGMIRPVREEAD